MQSLANCRSYVTGVYAQPVESFVVQVLLISRHVLRSDVVRSAQSQLQDTFLRMNR